MKTLIKNIILLPLLFLCGCNISISLVEKEQAEESLVSLMLKTDKSISKSSLHINETKIENICVFGYTNGKLDQYTYLNGNEDIKLYLRKGISYNLYAIANCGDIGVPSDESKIGEVMFSIPSISHLQGKTPLSWSKKGIIIHKDSESITAHLERLISKIWLSIDKSSLEGLFIRSARLCQSPLVVYPFMDGGSKVTDSRMVGDGDYASNTDIGHLNKGESIFFYTFENCQGSLLPENNDPWKKVPQSLGEKASLCTYLEIECEFGQDALYEGGVKYRLYLGKDNCSNFDVTRNHNIHISLELSEDAIEKISWKVDANVNPTVDLIWEQSVKAEYLYQYGEINFPNATNTLPIKINHGGSDILIGSDTAQSIESEGIHFHYIPTTPTKLYYYYTKTTGTSIKIQQGPRSGEYNIPSVDMHTHKVELSKNSVNEDGYDSISGTIKLLDSEGRNLPKKIFFHPNDIKAYYSYSQADDINRVNNLLTNKIVFYENQSNKSIDNFTVQNLTTQKDDSHILAKFSIYGLEADGEDDRVTTFYCLDSVTSNEIEETIAITPAFRDQKWLGEYTNLQAAPGSKKSSSLTLVIEGTGSSESIWEISRIPQGLSNTSTKPSAAMLGPKNKYVSFKKSSEILTLDFKTPAPFASGVQPNRADDFFPCGAMLIKGSVTNPYSGKTKVGHYTLDLILYVSVGVQVDIYPSGYTDRPSGEVTGISTSDLWWEFIPFNEYCLHAYSSFWKNSIFSRIRVVSQFEGKKVTTVYPSDRFSDMAFKTTLSKYYPFDYLSYYTSEIAGSLNSMKNQYFCFEFQTSVSSTTPYKELIVTRDKAKNYGDLSSYGDGSLGYYHIVRQYDIANYPVVYGPENYVYDIAEDALDYL
jgi:hypothetical protein